MMRVSLVCWMVVLAMVAMPAVAGSNCGDCGNPCGEVCYTDCDDPCCDTCFYADAGTENYIEVAMTESDLTGLDEIENQYGYYPEQWYSSGRLISTTDVLSPDRFEVRWSDVNEDSGRAWVRWNLWPMTFDLNGLYNTSEHWGLDGANPEWVERNYRQWDTDMRFHDGNLSDMLLSFNSTEFVRPEGTRKPGYDGQTLAYQWNFKLSDGDVRGQYRQIATAFSAVGVFVSEARLDTSQLKLDATLSDDWSAYTKIKYTAYNYENLADDSFSGSDYTIGLRYVPDCFWEVDASYRTKSNPTDNTVSSHVDGLDEYGLKVSYVPGSGNYYEGGFRHRTLDYAQLNMQDGPTRSLLRGTAVTPADVAAATLMLEPEYDDIWVSFNHDLGDDLSLRSRMDYSTGDDIETHVVAADSPGLYYNERATYTQSLTYDHDRFNQFELTLFGEESSSGNRGSNFDMNYWEGSWTHCCGNEGWLTLGYRDSTSEIVTPLLVSSDYATDDTTYLAVFSQDRANFGYALNASVTDATGAEEFSQTTAGVDLKLKSLGPWKVRLDWFDREYGNFSNLDTEAVEFGVEYKLTF